MFISVHTCLWGCIFPYKPKICCELVGGGTQSHLVQSFCPRKNKKTRGVKDWEMESMGSFLSICGSEMLRTVCLGGISWKKQKMGARIVFLNYLSSAHLPNTAHICSSLFSHAVSMFGLADSSLH